MELKFKKLNPIAVIPQYQTAGAAAMDLVSVTTAFIQPGERKYVDCGFAMELPPGYVGLVCSRSGLARKHGVFVLNAPGVIDEDYRGPMGVLLQNSGEQDFTLYSGDRVAQLLIIPYARFIPAEVYDLSDTKRGDGGWGSSGVR
jgi:dUTP pyrophosphatase